jgi:hypothetical protein
MIVVTKTPPSPSRSVAVGGAATASRLPRPSAGGASPDIALRAAECALFELRRGAADPAKALYLRAHSLLRELRRHLALLDARLPAA